MPDLNSATEQEIAAALQQASVPALMMSMIHMSGDTKLLSGAIRPGRAELSEIQGFLSEPDKQQVRDAALKVILDFRANGCQLPPSPDADTLERMMAFVAGVPEGIGATYVSMMREEMLMADEASVEDNANADARTAAPSPASLARYAERTGRPFSVAVIGAGMSGLLAGIRLKQAGIPFTIYDKNAEPGGTWYENRYPGCRVDIASHFYSYSFEPGNEWSHYFAQRDDLFAYFKGIVAKYELEQHIQFNAEIASMRWQEDSQQWQLEISEANQPVLASAVISGTGQLNRPKIPDLPGRKDFTGEQCHTAQWPVDLDLSGKRVAVVGTGASAFQLVPAIVDQVTSLTVFQRSPGWFFPNFMYHEEVSDGTRWCLQHIPFYQKWFRFLLFWPGSDGAYPRLQRTVGWDDGGKSISAENKALRDGLEAWIDSQVSDPELRAKVTPDYPPFGKRINQDNGGWLRSLQKDHVTLVTQGVDSVGVNGPIAAGDEYPADIIIWATGFHASRFLWPVDVIGENSALLSEVWGDEPRALLGIAAPAFPNLFFLYGPNTNLAHAGSVIFNSECQVRQTLSALKLMLEKDSNQINANQDRTEQYHQRMDDLLETLVWSAPNVNSWYQNSRGKNIQTLPWLLADYWQWTASANPDDYDLN